MIGLPIPVKSRISSSNIHFHFCSSYYALVSIKTQAESLLFLMDRSLYHLFSAVIFPHFHPLIYFQVFFCPNRLTEETKNTKADINKAEDINVIPKIAKNEDRNNQCITHDIRYNFSPQ